MKFREQWLNDRRTGIGGSDVAPILGLSKWATPLDVYLDKIGEGTEIEDNAAMKWGRNLESAIRQEYADQTGRAVHQLAHMLRHPKHEFMIANLDGETSCGRVFEAKTARSADGWGEPGTDQVPDAYALQVQHYMIVRGFDVADIAVLIGGSDFRIYTVEADRELQQGIISAEAVFWNRVQTRTPPEPVSFADAVQRYGRSKADGIVEASPAALAAHADLVALRHEIDEIDRRQDEAKAILMRELGDVGDTLTCQGKTLATWKLAKGSETFDTTRFKAEHPDIYKAFVVQREGSRRLLIKD